MHPGRDRARGAYMLNTRNEENLTVFYSYVACFVNTFTLNMYVFMSYIGAVEAVAQVYPGGDRARGAYMLNTRNEENITFFCLFCEYIQLEYVRIHVIYRVHESEYGIRILWLRHRNT